MKKGKLTAPIVITVLLCLWFGGWIGCLWIIPALPLWAKFAGGLIPLGLIGVSIAVLVERIKEIRSGEEHDLDNY